MAEPLHTEKSPACCFSAIKCKHSIQFGNSSAKVRLNYTNTNITLLDAIVIQFKPWQFHEVFAICVTKNSPRIRRTVEVVIYHKNLY